MTTDDIIDGILQREGGWRDQVTRPDGSIDPPTNKGITLPTLTAWWRSQGLESTPTVVTLSNLTDDEARMIYQDMYIDRPGFTTAAIPFEPLRVQLIDFGVNSGPERAIRWLQRVLGVPVTGHLDLHTRLAIDPTGAVSEHWRQRYFALVNDALVAARSYMIDQSVDQGLMRKQDEEGVESRALSFFLARPE